MKYDKAMEYIANTSRFGMNFGLDRVKAMLSLLGNPQDNLKCIHIAGTNGKGSTTAMITSILKEEGYAIGMYTSPYLEEFEERIQINGVNIPKNKLAILINRIKEVIEEVVKKGYDNPTQFEIITTLMFLYFSDEKVDFVVLEVGLGGRLDATNVITPLISVIGSISYDHMNILGETIEEIAFEKCGIIKVAPVVSYPQVEDAKKVIEDVCKKNNANLLMTSVDSIKNIKSNKTLNTQIIEYDLNGRSIKVEHSLLGEHQAKNTLVALSVIDEFSKIVKPISDDVIKKGLLKARWIGRMEVMGKEPLVVIDGAHNIDGIINLKNSVDKYFNYNKVILILGILGDKQVEEMIKNITTMAKFVILTEPHNERAESIEKIGAYLEELNKPYDKILDYKKAYEKSLELANNDDLILVCGSLYMIGDMRRVIRKF